MKSKRSESWSKAKKTGHLNEEIVCDKLGFGFSTSKKKVESVFNDKTPPKSDIYGPYNLSLKKSLVGQVHMNKVNRWIEGYESIYGEIPENVKKVFFLLFGGYDFDVDKKYVLWEKVAELEPQVTWFYDKNNKLKKETFDTSDAYVAARGFMMKSGLWKV